MIDNRLTILLTLKGRPLYTLRWLWYADLLKLPFKVIIADGEVDERLASLLESKTKFNNVDYEYIRFSDSSLSEFYKKCLNIAKRVKTPYAMLTDNDDFLMLAGLKKSLDFLDENPDFVSSQGGISGFSLTRGQSKTDNILGEISKYYFRYSIRYETRNIDSSVLKERVINQVLSYHPIYYSIIRSNCLVTVLNEIEQYNFTSLQLHELFFSYRVASLGKVHSTSEFSFLMRQRSTTLRNQNRDWVSHFVKTNYSSELLQLNNQFQRIFELDKVNSENLNGSEFIDAFTVFLREWLKREFSSKSLSLKDRIKRKYSYLIDPRSEKNFNNSHKESLKDFEELEKELKLIISTLNSKGLEALILDF